MCLRLHTRCVYFYVYTHNTSFFCIYVFTRRFDCFRTFVYACHDTLASLVCICMSVVMTGIVPVVGGRRPSGSTALSRFEYSEANLLGKGTYAHVFVALDTETNERVALKRIEFDFMVEGCPLLLLREVGLVRRFRHPNLVPIVGFAYNPYEGLALIAFELLEFDLRKYLTRNGPLKGRELFDATHQLVNGLDFLHSNGIMHRDLKPQNVLVGSCEGGVCLKIGDFGLARLFTPRLSSQYTKEVMTLWYRCPELLLGGRLYGSSCDMWSLGCLIGEMGSGSAMFAGESEVAVLFRIFKTLGSPTGHEWPGVETLPHFSAKFPKWKSSEKRVKELLFHQLFGVLNTPRDRLIGADVGRESELHMYSTYMANIMRDLFHYAPGKRLTAFETKHRLESITSTHKVRE